MSCSNSLIWKKLNIKTLFPSLCFSAQNLNYVQKAKTFEKLKTTCTFDDKIFHDSKYMVMINTNLICTEGCRKLLWKNFQGDLMTWLIRITVSQTSFTDEKFALNEIKSLNLDIPQKILLDLSINVDTGNICMFALDFDICSDEDILTLESKIGGKFINARESLFKLNETECQFVAKAKGLAHFNKTFNYCPKCGNKLEQNAIGTLKNCSECLQTHYPYVAPVGIVLLENIGHDKVLLTRQSRHPPGMFSCVAGFLEPGETLYQGIEREVAEEVGLSLAKIEFFNSQHWAMPTSQLMLACIGTVESEGFDLDEKEIEKAIWVTADALREAITHVNSVQSISSVNSEKDFWLPPNFTAAHQLMVEWLRRYHSS